MLQNIIYIGKWNIISEFRTLNSNILRTVYIPLLIMWSLNLSEGRIVTIVLK